MLYNFFHMAKKYEKLSKNEESKVFSNWFGGASIGLSALAVLCVTSFMLLQTGFGASILNNFVLLVLFAIVGYGGPVVFGIWSAVALQYQWRLNNKMVRWMALLVFAVAMFFVGSVFYQLFLG